MMPVRLLIIHIFLFQVVILHGQHISVEAKKQTGRILFSLPFSSASNPLRQTALQIETEGRVEGISEGKTIFTGSVRKNRLEGEWISYHANGQMLDSGYLVRGIPDGTWKVWDSDGLLRHVRQYDADLFVRIEEEIKTKHPRYQKYVLTNRYIKEGEEALQVMRGSNSFNHTSISQHATLESLVNYNSRFLSNYHPPFISCLHNGIFINYDNKGNISDSGYYRNGLREDIWTHYHAVTGLTEKGAYRKGMKFHTWKTYDRHGKLIQLSYYNDEGKLEWEKEKAGQ